MLNVFVSEYLCSGACEESRADESLLTEGAAMLDAVIADLLEMPDCRVTTCVQKDLDLSVFQREGEDGRFQIHRVREPGEEQDYFDQSCLQADVVWIIAPEFDEILYSRTARAIELGAKVVGPELAAIQLTADKWRLFEFLNELSLPTIPTSLPESELSPPPYELPCIIKHRFGAGGLGLQRLTQPVEWLVALSDLQENGVDYIVQPFVFGQLLSTVVLFSSERREIFPIGEQHICWESGYEYQGGMLPAELNAKETRSIQQLLERVCDALPGLAGYIGVDLLLPDSNPAQPLIVEINPRLTTSYTGYRYFTQDNLAERIVDSETKYPPLSWDSWGRVQFLADGSVFLNPKQF
ncbi:MAG: ATP-grasp domain-containing protein [Planctomycetota bacterium]